MNTPKSQQLNVVIPAYRWHSQIFLMLLDGITEDESLKRIDNRTNHIIWMTGNFVNVRYALANALGIKEQDPYHDLFFMGKALDTGVAYPSLEALKASFHKISPLAYKKLLDTTDEELEKVFPMGMDVSFSPENMLNFIGMCIGREDYLSGQLALMRRILDHSGITYEVNDDLKY